jgi:hypothetical protein
LHGCVGGALEVGEGGEYSDRNLSWSWCGSSNDDTYVDAPVFSYRLSIDPRETLGAAIDIEVPAASRYMPSILCTHSHPTPPIYIHTQPSFPPSFTQYITFPSLIFTNRPIHHRNFHHHTTTSTTRYSSRHPKAAPHTPIGKRVNQIK